jgi:hypothetical protein
MVRGDGIGRHEAHIVPVQRVLRPRIAEADKELHLCILTETKDDDEEGDGR